MNYYLQPQEYAFRTFQTFSSLGSLERGHYTLKVRQQPVEALVVLEGKDKNRKPVDPPPIVELDVNAEADPLQQYLQSPFLFMQCHLVTESPTEPTHQYRLLCGSTVSSLHRLKDIDNKDGGFFVFGDLSVRQLGRHRLEFRLFEMNKDTSEVTWLASVQSEEFLVVTQKDWSGLRESSHLSRTFSDQGVRLRLRKEGRNGVKRKFSNYASDMRTSSGPPPMTSQYALTTPAFFPSGTVGAVGAYEPPASQDGGWLEWY